MMLPLLSDHLGFRSSVVPTADVANETADASPDDGEPKSAVLHSDGGSFGNEIDS